MHMKSITPYLSRAAAGAYRFAQDSGIVTLPIIIVATIAEVLL